MSDNQWRDNMYLLRYFYLLLYTILFIHCIQWTTIKQLVLWIILRNKGADFELKEMFWLNYLSQIINFIKLYKIILALDDKHLKGINEILPKTRLNKTRKNCLVENIFFIFLNLGFVCPLFATVYLNIVRSLFCRS